MNYYKQTARTFLIIYLKFWKLSVIEYLPHDEPVFIVHKYLWRHPSGCEYSDKGVSHSHTRSEGYGFDYRQGQFSLRRIWIDNIINTKVKLM